MAEVDIVETVKEQESKRSPENSNAESNKKKKDKKKKSKKEKEEKPEEPGLPPKVEERKIRCKERLTNSVDKVTLKDIKATNKTVYVHDIHDANPQVLETMYWVVLRDHRFVCAMVSKEDWEYIVNNGSGIRHHLRVVDCGVFPTLSYSFNLMELENGEFPTLAEIEEKDEEFRNNPTNFHNPSLIVKLVKTKSESSDDKKEVTILDDDEEFVL